MAVNDMLDMLQDDDYGFVALGEGEGDMSSAKATPQHMIYTSKQVLIGR